MGCPFSNLSADGYRRSLNAMFILKFGIIVLICNVLKLTRLAILNDDNLNEILSLCVSVFIHTEPTVPIFITRTEFNMHVYVLKYVSHFHIQILNYFLISLVWVT